MKYAGYFSNQFYTQKHLKTPSDIQAKDDIFLVFIPKQNKTSKDSYFKVSSPYIVIVKYYIALRPPGQEGRFS